ncbi:TPA: hypothetical protein HA278_08445 [Candidatus Woesearchaeota archaeon]|nr:hypothetical protein [archaeon]HIJ12060.1 hypothetical protein [Candidatus Woesearchaeota archaeon]
MGLESMVRSFLPFVFAIAPPLGCSTSSKTPKLQPAASAFQSDALFEQYVHSDFTKIILEMWGAENPVHFSVEDVAATQTKLVVEYSDGKTHEEVFSLPTGIALRVIGSHLIAYDTHNPPAHFQERSTYSGDLAEGDYVLLTPTFEDQLGNRFRYAFENGKEGTFFAGTPTLTAFLEKYKRALDNQEFTKAKEKVQVGSQTFELSGPNRDGMYHLPADTGASSLLYHPRSGHVAPGDGWGSVTVTGDIRYTNITIHETLPGCGQTSAISLSENGTYNAVLIFSPCRP